MQSHLLWIQICGPISGDMLSQPIYFKTLVNGFEDDLLQRSNCMFAELAGMSVMAVRHPFWSR
jgi:hypothetical protein